jgi:hypothetical protein
MNFVRKHKVISIIILIFLILFLFIGISFGKYILNILNNYILETKSFYFNSSILKLNGKSYSINNWDGVNSYTLTIDVNNRKTEEKYTTSDIKYSTLVECSSNVTCTLSKSEGVIYEDVHTDSYEIVVTPKSKISENDTVTVTTSAISSFPFKKTISATYNIGVEKSNFSYEIEDSSNSKYFTLRMTNSIPYYEVKEAFGDYKVGDQITIDKYETLTESEKSKFFSATVTLSFDPKEVILDMTNDLYLDRLSNNFSTTTIDGYSYVNKFSFNINASSSNSIIFYKKDISKDYTYPIVNDTPVVTVSVKTAT